MPSNVMVGELYNHLRTRKPYKDVWHHEHAPQLLATSWIMTPQLLTKHHCSITLLTSPSRHAPSLGRTTWNVRHSGTRHGNAKTFSGGLCSAKAGRWGIPRCSFSSFKMTGRAGH